MSVGPFLGACEARGFFVPCTLAQVGAPLPSALPLSSQVIYGEQWGPQSGGRPPFPPAAQESWEMSCLPRLHTKQRLSHRSVF